MSNIGCVNIPSTPFMFSFQPSFTHGYSHLLCHWATALSLARAAKRLFPSAGSRFLCVPAFSHRPRACRLGTTADIRSDPFQYHFNGSPCGLQNLTCGNNARKALFHSSHWLTRMSKTWMNPKPNFSTDTPQNHGS